MSLSLNYNSSCIRPQPGYLQPLPWRPFPSRPLPEHNWNLPDQNVGSPFPWRCFPFGNNNGNNGYVLDSNHNGRYDRGRDGVLVFDLNRDGKYDQRDVSNTNDLMKAAAGNYDFNGDGHVSAGEKMRGAMLRSRYQQLDRNRDGRLDTWEIQAGGGKVWVDRSRGGGISENELHSPYNIPGRWFGEGSRRLDFVDPVWGNGTSRNTPWWNPFGSGIRPTHF